MAHADDLLGGPRGRRACWELLNTLSFELATASPPSDSGTTTALMHWRDLTEKGQTRALFDSVRASADAARYWQDPDEDDLALATPDAAAELTPLAHIIGNHSSSRWWSDSLDRASQVVTVFSHDPAEDLAWPNGAAAGLREWHDETARSNVELGAQRSANGEELWAITSHYWWTPPIGPRIASTTRTLKPFGPIGLSWIEDGSGATCARSYPVAIDPDVRVFEIGGPSSWSELVARYPFDVTHARGANWLQATGRDGAWLIPDWHAVAGEFDAVHLTVDGYLSTSGLVVSIDDQYASFIAGWHPDETYWLTDVLIPASPTDWIHFDQEDTWTPTGP